MYWSSRLSRKTYGSTKYGSDLEKLKLKVEAGADYVSPKCFLTIKSILNLWKAKAIGINVPIIPGIKPLAVQKHLQVLPKVFSLDLPNELVVEVEKCKDNTAIRQVGMIRHLSSLKSW